MLVSIGHWKHIGDLNRAAALGLSLLSLQVVTKPLVTSPPLGARTGHLARKSHEGNETLGQAAVCSAAVEVPLSYMQSACTFCKKENVALGLLSPQHLEQRLTR